MPGRTYLIVNADDFGRSEGINRGIVEAHEHGIVTSASLMVSRPGTLEAARYAQLHPELSTGIHLELPLPQRVDPTIGIQEMVLGQVARFRELVGKGPSHIDSHRHVHRQEPLRSITAEVARRLGVPLREFDSRIRFCSDFYGQMYGGLRRLKRNPKAISPEGLASILAELEPGVTELCCHPGYVDDLDSSRHEEPYRRERTRELRTLCDPKTRRTLERLGVVLCRFEEVVAN
jgi:chitin disaccharide deacetylase